MQAAREELDTWLCVHPGTLVFGTGNRTPREVRLSKWVQEGGQEKSTVGKLSQ